MKRSKTCRKPHKLWFRAENVTIFEWPSYSLDLDPLLECLKNIKDEINQKRLKNIEGMMREVASYWDSTRLKLIQIL